jgi:NAD(P)-dependent dehydrogenase (short-subunit alcohol dehydrogenase family)
MVDLKGKKVIITGSAKRIGRELALASAKAGASVIIHHHQSQKEAEQTANDISKLGVKAEIIRADFSEPQKSREIFDEVFQKNNNVFALINNAAIFKPVKFANTSLEDWRIHMDINLTMPFLLSQSFASSLGEKKARIVNILDWRALRPGYDHFPYTISKSALAALTQTLALSLAPNIQVNGIALGTILPPVDGTEEKGIISKVPAGRWADVTELADAYLFLLQGPEYITGEIIHLDGGRHLV